jgi:hypothetical protein
MFVRNQTPTQRLVAQAKVDITNARKTAHAILKLKYDRLDPIVHENSCQIRALKVVQSVNNNIIREEARRLFAHTLELERKLCEIHPNETFLSLEDLIQKKNLQFQMSEDMSYLAMAHFLTIGKIYRLSPTGQETARIENSKIHGSLSKKVDNAFLNGKIADTQSKIAEASVKYIQEQARVVSPFSDPECDLTQRALNHTVDVSDNPALKKPCTHTFYNFKTIMLRLKEGYHLVYIKEYSSDKSKNTGVFLRASHQHTQTSPSDEKGFRSVGSRRPGDFEILSDEELSKLDKKAPVYVIEGLLPKNMSLADLKAHIKALGVLNICLYNAALVNPFSKPGVTTDFMEEKAKAEINEHQRKGRELKCQKENPGIFTIVHTHASSVKLERTKV